MSNDTQSTNLPKLRDWLSFISLWFAQALNTFNDKASQFLIITLGASIIGKDSPLANDLAGYLMLPFIFFAPLTGWLSDRFSKVIIFKWMQVVQLIILTGMVFSLSYQSLDLMIVFFVALAIQSAFLSPAKKGLIYESIGPNRVGFGTGILELGTIVFAIAGMVVAPWILDNLAVFSDNVKTENSPLATLETKPFLHWDIAQISTKELSELLNQAGHVTTFIKENKWEVCKIVIWPLWGLAVLSFVSSFLIQPKWKPTTSIGNTASPWDYLGPLKAVFSNRNIGYAAVIPIFFSAAATWIPLVNEQYIREAYLESHGTMLSTYGAYTGVGIITGAIIGAVASFRRVELHLMPLIMLALSSLAVIGAFYFDILHIAMPLQSVQSAFGVYTMILGNAYVIKNVPEQRRGRAIAGVNFLQSLFAFFTTLIHKGAEMLHISIELQCWMLFGLCILYVIISFQGFGRELMRSFITNGSRLGWRMKTLGKENLPVDTGVLIASNHVTWLDSGMVNATMPRKVRFLMAEEYSKMPLVGPFTDWFDTILVTPTKAKEALVAGANAIKEGSAVCIFPEGRLTRSGQMNEIKRGFQLMARQAKAPVMPLYMDGLWGSITSFERGKYFKKMPYFLSGQNVIAACGEPLDAKSCTPERLRQELEKLSYQCLEERMKRLPSKALKTAKAWAKKGQLNTSPEAIVANARQLQNVHLHTEQSEVVIHVLTSAQNVLPVLETYKALTHHIKAIPLINQVDEIKLDAEAQNIIVGTLDDRSALGTLKLKNQKQEITFLELHDIATVDNANGRDDLEEQYPHLKHCPCLINQNLFATISLPFSVDENTNLAPELGRKPNTYGKLLPGAYYSEGKLRQYKTQPTEFSRFSQDLDGFIYRS